MNIVGAYLIDTTFGPAVVPAGAEERVEWIVDWCASRDDVPEIYFQVAVSR